MEKCEIAYCFKYWSGCCDDCEHSWHRFTSSLQYAPIDVNLTDYIQQSMGQAVS